MDLKATLLNCTLKHSPETSNTEALLHKLINLFEGLGVECDLIRVVDYNIPFGVRSDEGPGDQWPDILNTLRHSDIIVVGTPIWLGERGSIAQMVMERLDGSYLDADPRTGQFPLYGKVAGVAVTGNEDGAHSAASTILFNLSHFGCVIPPNPDCYWVGEAGPGPSYIEARGDRHLYTNRTARYLVHNTVYLAGLLKQHPIPTDLAQLDREAQAESD